MTTLVQEFATYCEQNGMPSDEVGSAAFYANWRKIHTSQNLTTDEWNDLLDFVRRTSLRRSARSRPTTGRLPLGLRRSRGEVTEQPKRLRARGHTEFVTQGIDAEPVLTGYQLLLVLRGVAAHQQPVHGLTAWVPRQR